MTSNRLCFQQLLLLSVLALVQYGHSGEVSKSYDTINAYLASNIKPPHHPEDCLRTAHGLMVYNEKGRLNSIYNRKLINSLHLFTSLNEAKSQCNLRTAQILRQNHQKTQNRVLRPMKGFNPITIVDKVVQHYAMEHAKLCKDILPEMAEQVILKVPASLKNDLQIIIKAVIDKKVSDKFDGKPASEIEFEKRVKFLFDDVNSFGTAFDGKQLLKVIKEVSKDVKEQEILDLQYRKNRPAWKVKKGDFVSIYDRHLKRPCLVLTGALGEVYQQAELDYKMYDDWFIPGRDEFYELWSEYRFCQHVLRPGNDDLLNNLIQASLGDRFHLED